MDLSAALLFLALIAAFDDADPAPTNICDLSKDFSAYRDKLIAVRGVYYYGLRDQSCPQKCADGPWPSFIELRSTDWNAIEKVEKAVEADAKTGRRFEIWVTAVGRLRTHARRSPLDPCDKQGSRYFGYGHLGAYPAQLDVTHFTDVVVKENPKSPYDYANMYHGPL
jgi:hypothetical protein